VCCSVLQCVPQTTQREALCNRFVWLHYVIVYCMAFQCVAVCCSASQCVAVVT